MSNRLLGLPTMPRAKRNDKPAKIDAEVLRKAKVVAAAEGYEGGVAEYLSRLLDPLVSRDYTKWAKTALRQSEESK